MQHIVPEITIPPEVTAADVTMYIVDTGCESLTYSPALFCKLTFVQFKLGLKIVLT